MDTKNGSAQQVPSYSVRGLFWPLALLAFGFVFITLHQSDYLRAVPGNMGDARFNNVVLEHLFLWFSGKEQGLWSPGFFFPYPGTLTFSDNHFGTAAVYILMRLFGLDPEAAFIGWYTVAAPLNYVCCYYTLRKLGISQRGSAVGAFVFTFALNVSARHGHAQLAYRFAIPLAMLAWQRFVEKANIKHLAILAAWVTVQFYGSIYLGYFLLLLIGATFVAQFVIGQITSGADRPVNALISAARAAVGKRAIGSVLAIVACGIALIVLFYPYMHYSRLYGFSRGYAEIESMLPRPSSYLLSDGSYLWGGFDKHIDGIPMRWEHQMFFGASTCLLAAVAVLRKPSRMALTALVSLLLVTIVTLDVRGHSLYSLIAHLPLANAIRAVTRIGLVMIFPVALMAGMGFDRLTATNSRSLASLVAALALVAFMLVEYTAYYTERMPIKELRDRYTSLESRVPSNLKEDAILYLPLASNEPYYYSEIDGIRLSQALHRNTINGYSGNAPVGFNDSSTDPCFMVNNRLGGYISFANLGSADYESLARRVVVIGMDRPCTLLTSLPQHTHFRGPVPGAVAKKVILRIESVAVKNGALTATLVIENHSDDSLRTISDDGHDIRYSWRMTPVHATTAMDDNWVPRKDLTADVPAGTQRDVETPIAAPHQEGRYRLEATLLQENVEWFHNLGMPIATSKEIVEVTKTGSIRIVE